MKSEIDAVRIVAWGVTLGLAMLVAVSLYIIVSPFLEGIAWAGVIVIFTWPVFRGIQRGLGVSPQVAALLMVFGALLMLLGLIVPLSLKIAGEIYEMTATISLNRLKLSDRLGNLPLLGKLLKSPEVSEAIAASLSDFGATVLRLAFGAGEGILRITFNSGVVLLSMHFFYTHGERTKTRIRATIRKFMGARYMQIVPVVEDTIKGVMYGALLTALAQGVLAGVGFYATGTPMPALLGIATMILSFVPFGAPLVYLPAAWYLVYGCGATYAGIALLLWGILVVSTVDNILRIFFVSRAVRLPVLLAFVSTLGGIMAFGLLGLFIGPITVGLCMAVWAIYEKTPLPENDGSALPPNPT